MFKIEKSTVWKAWLNTVRDYEDSVLGGRDGEYPDDETVTLQRWERYKFIETDNNSLIFQSEKDYTWFILRWS